MDKELLGYHGTNQRSFDFIKRRGFRKQVSDNSFPNDLGLGAYFYTDRIKNEAKENAKKYVLRYKKSYVGRIVLEVPILVDEDKVLNFNENDTAETLEEFIRENRDSINKELEKYDSESSAFRRGNFDGIAIDLFIDYFGIAVDMIIKDTFTSFDDYQRSNFNNGREVCIKDTEVIDEKRICIVEHIY